MTQIPWAWGFFFWLVDLKILRPLVRWIRRFLNHLNTKNLQDFLEKENFDWIFSTHFFPNEVLSHLKRKGNIRAKIVSVITDFDVHSIWITDGIDYYTAACEFTKEKLLALGVPAENIFVYGIPTDQKFSQKLDQATLRKKLGFNEDLFTVLVATGSFGIGPIEKIIEALSAQGFQVVVVCGHNKKMFERLNEKPIDRVKVCGLVHNMHELMALSDCMITKPGGLSISEALVRHLPLIFFNAIPGQETQNIAVLKTYGIGISGCSIQEMVEELRKLRSSPEVLHNAQRNIQKLARPDSVAQIISLIHE